MRKTPLSDKTPSSSLFHTSISPSSPSSFYLSPSVLSILLFIFLPSCPLPHTCQLCLPSLSKLEFLSLTLRKVVLSLKGVFLILSSYDGDSEEDNDDEVVKQVVKRRFEGR
jgi:hypothetical protein